MAKISDIITQLQAVLPKYTDKFNGTYTITGMTSVGGGVFEIETSSAHGLVDGNYVVIKGVLVKNEIAHVSIDNGIVTASTSFLHDLTQDYPGRETVYLSGFDTPADGDQTLLTVPTTSTFTFALASLPVGTGYLNEDRIDGINGRFEVTYVSATKFRITSTTSFSSFTLTSSSIATSPLRFTGEVEPERIMAHYKRCPQTIDEYFGFVVNNPTTVSFSRNIRSDANQKMQRADEMRYECIQTFSVYVVAPSTDTLSGRNVQDDMVDIRTALCKSLCGIAFDSGFETEPTRYLTTFNGDGYFTFVGAYYIHVFDFETVYNFNPGDAADEADTRAFRSFAIDLSMQFDDYAETKKQIDGTLPAT